MIFFFSARQIIKALGTFSQSFNIYPDLIQIQFLLTCRYLKYLTLSINRWWGISLDRFSVGFLLCHFLLDFQTWLIHSNRFAIKNVLILKFLVLPSYFCIFAILILPILILHKLSTFRLQFSFKCKTFFFIPLYIGLCLIVSYYSQMQWCIFNFFVGGRSKYLVKVYNITKKYLRVMI